MVGLLIDADLFLYQAAAAVEEETDWGDDFWTLHSDVSKAREVFAAWMDEFVDILNPNEVVLCFSDPTRKTFRHDLFPGYKSGRGRKPVAYSALRDELLEKAKCVWKPRLEADDCMGIISTRAPGRYIIVSEDKDMKSVPGLHYNPGHHPSSVFEVSTADADWFHLMQTLTGDATDGYKGCPGIGAVKATKIVADGWPGVVAAFKKAKLTEDDALLQARLARILRASDWDFNKSEVKLWTPTI